MAKFFINRPIVAMVIAILMVIIGIFAMLGLPVAQFPNIVPPEMQVTTNYIGADALTVEQAVATPIEQQMSGVDNMNYMYSINANNGWMQLRVNLDVKTDPNIDQVLTQMRESQAESQLPSSVRNYGGTVLKSTTSPLIMFALYSPKGIYDNIFLANYAFININDQMTRVKGIACIVRIKDVGRIELGAQAYDMVGHLNGKPAALVALYQLPGSNAIDAANGAKKLMEELKQRFPADLD